MAISGRGVNVRGWAFRGGGGLAGTLPRKRIEYGDQDAAEGLAWLDWFLGTGGGITTLNAQANVTASSTASADPTLQKLARATVSGVATHSATGRLLIGLRANVTALATATLRAVLVLFGRTAVDVVAAVVAPATLTHRAQASVSASSTATARAIQSLWTPV